MAIQMGATPSASTLKTSAIQAKTTPVAATVREPVMALDFRGSSPREKPPQAKVVAPRSSAPTKREIAMMAGSAVLGVVGFVAREFIGAASGLAWLPMVLIMGAVALTWICVYNRELFPNSAAKASKD